MIRYSCVQPYLLPGERILWTGQPQQGIVLRSADLYLVPVGLFLAAFAAAWNFPVWEGAARSPFAFEFLFMLAGTGLLAAGLYASAGRFLHEAWLRRHLVYAVTTRRVLVVRTGRWPRLRSIELGYLPTLEYDEHGSGRGTLHFELDDDEGGQWLRWWWLGSSRYRVWIASVQRLSGVRFDRIEQPRAVYDLVRREADRCRQERQAEPPSRYSFVG